MEYQTIFPQNKKNRPKYVRKMYFMGFTLFCPGDLVTHTGEWEIRSVSGKLPDNPKELAYIDSLCDEHINILPHPHSAVVSTPLHPSQLAE